MGEADAAGCVGKVSYASFNEAQRAGRKREGKINAYRCHFCRCIHLGRTRGKKRKPRVAELAE